MFDIHYTWHLVLGTNSDILWQWWLVVVDSFCLCWCILSFWSWGSNPFLWWCILFTGSGGAFSLFLLVVHSGREGETELAMQSNATRSALILQLLIDALWQPD